MPQNEAHLRCNTSQCERLVWIRVILHQHSLKTGYVLCVTRFYLRFCKALILPALGSSVSSPILIFNLPTRAVVARLSRWCNATLG
jgi:hypothetical protein